jgi:hypothetical protein
VERNRLLQKVQFLKMNSRVLKIAKIQMKILVLPVYIILFQKQVDKLRLMLLTKKVPIVPLESALLTKKLRQEMILKELILFWNLKQGRKPNILLLKLEMMIIGNQMRISGFNCMSEVIQPKSKLIKLFHLSEEIPKLL